MLIPLSLVLLFRLINKPEKPPIFGVYQQKNKYYWCKYVMMYVVLAVRKVSRLQPTVQKRNKLKVNI